MIKKCDLCKRKRKVYPILVNVDEYAYTTWYVCEDCLDKFAKEEGLI
jgi:ribosome-binding protein aMBF1 (putative translation factor)